jgi:glycosyltransferase involved in cell wall biosynthesis
VVWVDDPTDDQLSVLYRDALGYVFPSRLEGFGLPPLEAMAAGVPVASSNTGSLPEVLGNAALYFNPTDEKAMATAMNALIQDQNLRTTLIARGQENIKRFSWDHAAKETVAVYQHTLP